MNELWVIGCTGAAVGGAIGWPLLRGPLVTNGVTTTSTRVLGALLIFGGLAAAAIGARHGAVLPSGLLAAAEHLVSAGNLVFWLTLTLWVRAALGVRTPAWLSATMFTIALTLYLAYAMIVGDAPPFIWLLPVGTCASVHLFVLRVRSRDLFPAGIYGAIVARMIGLALALNTAQAIRTFFPRVELLREIVPITMTAGFLSLAGLAVRGLVAGQETPPIQAARRYARSALDDSTADRLLAALDRGMRDERWYCDASLSLPELAARLGSRPHVVSQALNQVKKTTLNDYLATWRVGEAKRLLVDRASDRFTIDALAESSGFRSRSAFYKAFKSREGMTPTEFRVRARASALPEPPR